MPDAVKAFRQNVQEKATDELVDLERHGAIALVAVAAHDPWALTRAAELHVRGGDLDAAEPRRCFADNLIKPFNQSSETDGPP